MNILFLCTSNLHRSRSAEFVFQREWPEHDIRSAGLSPKECSRRGGRLCTDELILWADKIYAMEEIHRDTVLRYSNIEVDSQKIEVLGIEDHYQFMDRGLIELLRLKTKDPLKNRD
jgi:predicted protein tyrosine phosphatase